MKYSYDIRLDFVADFKAIAEKWLTEAHIERKNRNEPDMDYFRLLQRLIVSKPRKVEKAKDFFCPTGYESALSLIEKTIRTGQNLHPFMTRNLMKLRREDLMLSDWGIYHLHLSTEVDKKDGFMQRSDWLLMVRIDEDVVYFITSVAHNERNVWTLKKYVEIIRANWPESIKQYKLPGVTAAEHVTEELHAKARKAGALTLTELDDGTCYMMIGGGYASDGTSTKAVRNHDYWYGQFLDAEAVIKHEFGEGGILERNPELKEYFSNPSMTDIHLVAFGKYGIWLFDNCSKLWILMKRNGKNWNITVTSYIWPENLETDAESLQHFLNNSIIRHFPIYHR